VTGGSDVAASAPQRNATAAIMIPGRVIAPVRVISSLLYGEQNSHNRA